MAEIQIFAFFPFLGVHLVDEAVVAVAIVGGEGGLLTGAAEQWGDERGAGVVGIHGRNAEEGLDGANDVDGGVEGVIDKGSGVVAGRARARRILADNQGDAAVGVDVVGAVLGVIFENEESSIVPIGAVGYGVHDAPDSQVIVSNGGGGLGFVLGATGGVVVGKAKQDELGHGVMARVAGGNELVEFVEEFVGAELVGIVDPKIRVQRVEVVAELELGGDIFGQDGDGPGIGTGATARVANIVWQRLAFVDEGVGAGQ